MELFLFYEEPDPDRWFPGDRHPRGMIRRLVRGKPRPGGVMRWFLNLQTGLDRLGVSYRLNDYRGLACSPNAVAHVVGKPHVIDKIPAGHPIVYGPGISAHPYENQFWGKADIALVLISCNWFKQMYDRDLQCHVPTAVWPAGVETDLWSPALSRSKGKVMVYDKIRWRRDEYESALIEPITKRLEEEGLDVVTLRYGSYLEEDFREQLAEVSAMIFLCEHETQGFAYLQTLSCDVPILAWDRGGDWQDPSMYPDRVTFGPVTSVPYFDNRCGLKFVDMNEFEDRLEPFLAGVSSQTYTPRDYVVENFDLATQAQKYLELAQSACGTT